MRTLVIGCIAVLGVSACSQTFEDPLLVDGPKSPLFESDLAQCRQISANHTQDQVKTPALQGAAIGAVVGALDSTDGDRVDDALIGAVIGGGIGALEGTVEQDEARRKILLRCMQGRGHRVLA
ncbi:hypothetical protein RSK20926_18067 [Roseobacter sp. SK209-2-6]|uniref:glycine zipper family protein n=1 Tax=Roseobacter sp. SK209-2-6 TaxID=388739 RepID=UPI0000F3F77B|nr:glycine zipper family protein [Roseobacter sp. SK209-2-6]EBA17670.1 hypothetical protein RSK20926_18067 [Roseobacter sp. SK209-2-6]